MPTMPQGDNAHQNVPHAMRAELAKRLAPPPKKGFLARLFAPSVKQSDSGRRSCNLVAVMILLDRGVALDGMVMGISEAGVLFRQASTYILDRTGTAVLMRFAEIELRGSIRDSGTDGYWVRLDKPLPKEGVSELIRFSQAVAMEEQPAP